MSGYDNSDRGQDAFLPGTSFNPDDLDWNPEDYLFIDGDLSNFDGTTGANLENAENNNGIPANSPSSEDPTLGGTTFNGAGFANGDVIPSQFTDLPMFASPPAQAMGAETMFNSSPVNPSVNSYNAMGLNNHPTWSPIDGDLTQQHLPTAVQSGYPVPPQPRQWLDLESTQFQQAGQALAGADVVDSHSNLKPNATGNHFFAPHTQGALPNVFHGFPRPAVAPARRTRALKPASDAQATASMTQENNNDANPAPLPAAPENKETKVKQKATQRIRPTTSNAKKTAVKEPIDDSQLLVSTLEEARTIAIKRIKLDVVDDDCDEVAANPDFWILKIAKAVGVDYRTQGEDHERLTEAGRTEFARWQKEHENKTWVILSAKKELKSKFAQSCALILYKKILEAHQLGLEDPGKAISNGGADTKIKCSERLNAAITAIEEYSIVKYDFLRRDRLEGLIASPVRFVKRKTENCLMNFKKKKPGTQIWLHVPVVKSQGKRKRKDPSPAPSDDEGNDEDEVEGESDENLEEPTKRTRRR